VTNVWIRREVVGDKHAVKRIAVKVDDPKYMPSRAHADDAGYDLRAKLPDGPVIIEPGQRMTVDNGVYLGLPVGYEAQVRPRSGLARKAGLTIVNSPGTVDAGYRGELSTILLNTGDNPIQIEDGDRIAQMVIHRLPLVGLDLVDDLDATDRGANGFGSSGVG
jgi:dUTP pyrophosphatase